MRKIFLFATLLLLVSCENKLRPVDYFQAFQNMRWLEGSWEGDYQGKPFCETWTFANDTLLVNKTIACDSREAEEGGAFIKIVDGQVVYANNPKQGEQSLQWQLADCNENRLRFTNPKAPYSQTMVFEHTPEDRWQATLVTNKDTIVYLLHRKN